MENAQILELLKNDQEYYNGIGRNYLSNSDINTLINNPRMFGRNSEPTLAMLQGSYFHTACLEPLKLKNFVLVDASTRTTNIYKDACKENNTGFMLLKKEAEEVDEMVNALMANKSLSKLVWDNGIKYEVPVIGEINKLMWKGKCDIINGDFIYDLKTTTSLDDFKYSAKKYNYDSQVAIYEHLTGKKMAFIVIEKGSNRLGFYQVSDEFRESGWIKIGKAIENYNKFYGSNPTEDVSQYYLNSYLF
jgi:hypothetical protein